MNRFPHEFSGGQQQRVGIARALACQPELIVCDEPISALDVSIQGQIINLLQDLQDKFEISYLFIAHDLSVVRQISDRVAVMYLGRIVELTSKNELYSNPRHPYSEALLSSISSLDPLQERRRKRVILKGDVPSLFNPPNGCHFHPRCTYSDGDLCKNERPMLLECGTDHYAACHYANKLNLRGWY
jgi:oligopeptide/dipeptide ABC transporter ATP-binding protein